MKNRINPFISSAALAASIVFCLGQTTSADILTWDGFDTVTSGAQGGNGTWNVTSTANWWNGTINVVWPALGGTDDDAVFANTAGTVTLGSAITANDLTFNTTGYILSGAQTLTLNGTTPTITTANGVTTTIGNNTATVIAGTVGLTKAGAGTLVLNGTTSNSFTGGLNINRGTLSLDFTNLGGSTPFNNLVANTNVLTLGGGTLSITGKSTTGTSSQTFASTTVNAGRSALTLTNGTGGTSVTANLGALTLNAGGVLTLTSAPSATVITTIAAGGNVALPVSGNAYTRAGLMYGSGSGTRFAQVNSSGTLVTMPTSAGWVTTGGSATTVYNTGTTAAVTLTGNVTTYGILGNHTSLVTQTLGNATNAFTLTTNGIININTGGLTFAPGTTPGSFQIGAERDLVINNANTGGTTFSARIIDNGAGASNVTINSTGTGVTTFSGANTYTGITTIGAGTLQIGAAADAGTISSSSAIVNNGSLIFSVGTGNRTYANSISGTGSLTHSGTGALTLSGNNSYTGATTLGAATGGIIVGSNNALGTAAGTTTVAAGASIGLSGGINYSTAETIIGSGGGSGVVAGQFAGASRGLVQSVSGNNTFAGAIQINAGGTTRFGTQEGAQLTLSGPITMSSGVTGVTVLFRAGANNGDFVTLSNSGNSWDTDTQIFTSNASTGAGVRLGVNNALPIGLSVIAGGTAGAGTMLDLASYNQELNGLRANADNLRIANSVNGSTSVLTLNNTANHIANSNTIIRDGGAGGTTGKIQLVKVGTFNQTLQGAHTYTGGTLIKNGSITLQSGNDRLATTGTVTLGDTTTTGRLVIGETATARNQTLAGLTTIGLGGSVVGATTSTDSVLTLNIASGTNIFGGTLGGAVGNENRLALTKSGTGTLSLTGTSTYIGATTISAGTLQVGSASALSSASAVSLANVATASLDLNGNSNSIGSLAGGGATGGNVTLGAGTLTTGGDNSSTTYAGNISGTGDLIKSGTGIFTLSGTTNGYTGSTAVNGGSLIVNGTLASSGVTVASGTTLGGIGSITNSVVINSGGTLSAATATTPGTLTMGSLTLDAGSNLSFEFGGTSDLISVTSSGGLTIDGGNLSLFAPGGVSALTTNGTYDLFNYNGSLGGSTSNLSIANSQAGKAYSLNDTGSIIQLILGTASISDWSNGTSNGLWTDSGNWTGGVPNSFGSVANFNIAGSSVAVDGAKTAGSIIFDNAVGYTLTGGASDTITLDNGIAAGAISTVTGSHTIDAPIVLTGAANITPATGTTLTLGGDISGARALNAAGAGTTILTGTNTYTTTTIAAGSKLQIGAGGTSGTLGSGAVTLGSGSTLEFNRSDAYTASNNINGLAGTLTMTDGAVTLSGTKSLSVLNLAGGSPIISGTNTIATANLTGGTGTLSGASTITTLAATGGTTDVTGSIITTANVSSSGTVNFSGANTITTLAASGGTTNSTGATFTTANVSGSGAVNFTGSNIIPTANISGGLATFSGTNTLTTLNLSGGTARAGSATGFGTPTTIALSGTGTLDINGLNVTLPNITSSGTTATVTTSNIGTGTDTLTVSALTAPNGAIFTDNGTRALALNLTSGAGAIGATTNILNTYSGGLILNAGMRIVPAIAANTVGSPGAITSGPFGRGTITLNGTTPGNGSQIWFEAANRTLVNDIIVNSNTGNGSRTGSFRIGSAGGVISGSITANDLPAVFAADIASSTLSLTGKLTGSNGFTFTNTNGTPSWVATLNNSSQNNDYAGNTTISGTNTIVRLGAANQIPNGTGTGNVVLGATFDLNGFSETINGLSGSGTVTIAVAGASVLTLGDNNTTSSFSGSITNSTGTLGIVKIGTGDQTFTATTAYTGGTQIDAGRLILGNATNTLANTGAVNVNGGELALGTNTDTVGAVILTSGSITGSGTALQGVLTGTGSNYDLRSGSVSAKLAGSIGLDKTTSGTVTLSADNTYTGTTSVTAGTLQLDGSTSATSLMAVGTSGTLTGSGTVNGNATLTGGGIINKSSGTIAGTLGVTGGNWNGAGAVTGLVTSSSGTFTIGSGANLTASSGLSVTGGTLTGVGTITGNTTIGSGATHNAGGIGTVGAQAIDGNLTYSASSIFDWDLSTSSTSTGFDTVSTTGTLSVGASTVFNIILGGTALTDLANPLNAFWNTPSGTQTWNMSDIFGSAFAANTFASVTSSANPTTQGSFTITGGGSTLTWSAVPEPTSALVGLLIAAGLLRRKRSC